MVVGCWDVGWNWPEEDIGGGLRRRVGLEEELALGCETGAEIGWSACWELEGRKVSGSSISGSESDTSSMRACDIVAVRRYSRSEKR